MTTQRQPVDRVVDAMVAAPIAVMLAARETARAGLVAVGYVLGTAATRAVDYRANSVLVPVTARSSSPGSVSTPTVDAPRSSETFAGRGTSVSSDIELLPIEGYDQLTGRQIVAALDDLTVEELEVIRVFEQAERRRQTILSAIDRSLGSEGT